MALACVGASAYLEGRGTPTPAFVIGIGCTAVGSLTSTLAGRGGADARPRQRKRKPPASRAPD